MAYAYSVDLAFANESSAPTLFDFDLCDWVGVSLTYTRFEAIEKPYTEVYLYRDCAAAIVRLAVTGATFNLPDFTYEWAISGLWCAIHPSLGVLAICLPTVRILIVKICAIVAISSRSRDTVDPPAIICNHLFKNKDNYNESHYCQDPH